MKLTHAEECQILEGLEIGQSLASLAVMAMRVGMSQEQFTVSARRAWDVAESGRRSILEQIQANMK